jgi:hypothetical protein
MRMVRFFKIFRQWHFGLYRRRLFHKYFRFLKRLIYWWFLYFIFLLYLYFLVLFLIRTTLVWFLFWRLFRFRWYRFILVFLFIFKDLILEFFHTLPWTFTISLGLFFIITKDILKVIHYQLQYSNKMLTNYKIVKCL